VSFRTKIFYFDGFLFRTKKFFRTQKLDFIFFRGITMKRQQNRSLVKRNFRSAGRSVGKMLFLAGIFYVCVSFLGGIHSLPVYSQGAGAVSEQNAHASSSANVQDQAVPPTGNGRTDPVSPRSDVPVSPQNFYQMLQSEGRMEEYFSGGNPNEGISLYLLNQKGRLVAVPGIPLEFMDKMLRSIPGEAKSNGKTLFPDYLCDFPRHEPELSFPHRLLNRFP